MWIIVTSGFPPHQNYGGARYIHGFAAALASSGEQVKVITNTPSPDGTPTAWDRSQPFSITRLEGEYSPVTLINMTRDLPALLRPEHSLKGIICSSWCEALVVQSVLPPDDPTPLYCFIHMEELFIIPDPNRIKVLQKCDKIFCYSRAMKDEAVNLGVEAGKITVLPPAVSEIFANQAPPLPRRFAFLESGEHAVILTPARLVKKKGQNVVIRAMPAILRQIPEALYIMAGTGPDLDYLRLLAFELGVQNKVLFTGFLEHEELMALYARSQVTVLASYRPRPADDPEGLGLVLLEAGACGSPVIGTKIGGIQEVIDDGLTGYLVPPNDPAALAEKAVSLIKNQGEARKMGLSGQAKVRDIYTWPNAISYFHQAIRDL